MGATSAQTLVLHGLLPAAVLSALARDVQWSSTVARAADLPEPVWWQLRDMADDEDVAYAMCDSRFLDDARQLSALAGHPPMPPSAIVRLVETQQLTGEAVAYLQDQATRGQLDTHVADAILSCHRTHPPQLSADAAEHAAADPLTVWAAETYGFGPLPQPVRTLLVERAPLAQLHLASARQAARLLLAGDPQLWAEQVEQALDGVPDCRMVRQIASSPGMSGHVDLQRALTVWHEACPEMTRNPWADADVLAELHDVGEPFPPSKLARPAGWSSDHHRGWWWRTYTWTWWVMDDHDSLQVALLRLADAAPSRAAATVIVRALARCRADGPHVAARDRVRAQLSQRTRPWVARPGRQTADDPLEVPAVLRHHFEDDTVEGTADVDVSWDTPLGQVSHTRMPQVTALLEQRLGDDVDAWLVALRLHGDPTMTVEELADTATATLR